PHSAHDVTVVLGGSEHDHAGGQRIEIDFLEYSEAIFIGHAEIQQQNIRLELRQHANTFVAVGSLTDNGDIVFAIQQLAQAVAENHVIVGHQNADRLFGFSHVSRAEPLSSVELHGQA